MNYEIVQLQEKIVVGVGIRTGNESPTMGEDISNLWVKLYQEGIGATIKNKTNEYAIGLYCDYDDKSDYFTLAGNEVSQSENPELTTKIIPAGKYAKFSIKGDMVTAVQKAWGDIWQMDLDRAYTGDFEEYLNSDWENALIDIYVALK